MRSPWLVLIALVVSPHVAHAQGPSAVDPDAAARAAFERARSFHDFDSFALDSRGAATLSAYMEAVTASIRDGSARATRAVERFGGVLAFRRPRWTIAALVEQGRIYETLALAMRALPPLPMDPRLGTRDRSDIMDRLQRTFDERVLPVECFAISRYVLAARAARTGRLDTPELRVALERLQAQSDSRIAECVAMARESDASLAPYRAGEFAPAPRRNGGAASLEN